MKHASAAGGRVTLARADAVGKLEVQLVPSSAESEIVREWEEQDLGRIILLAPPREQSGTSNPVVSYPRTQRFLIRTARTILVR